MERGRTRSNQTRTRTDCQHPKMGGIIKKIDRKDGLSLNKMAKQLDIFCSSVQLTLGLRSYRLFNGQVLTDQAKHNRKEKCKKLREFFKVRIGDVFWSDEKVFTVEVATCSQNHRQLLSPALKNNRKQKIAKKFFLLKAYWFGAQCLG
ncbi:unnamed protein product [Strongylus vulgaris]|uniref:Uncharacterized protein n=1 Tax=Strongylus vulgaris TaxID=40348 RepID=A0A3P7JS77_STRVU|nr:unnamed protein product [Strongylus vulgaris]